MCTSHNLINNTPTQKSISRYYFNKQEHKLRPYWFGLWLQEHPVLSCCVVALRPVTLWIVETLMVARWHGHDGDGVWLLKQLYWCGIHQCRRETAHNETHHSAFRAIQDVFLEQNNFTVDLKGVSVEMAAGEENVFRYLTHTQLISTPSGPMSDVCTVHLHFEVTFSLLCQWHYCSKVCGC